jgi:protease PrsW
MGFILSVLFGFVPMLFFAWILYWLDRYEKEPILMLGGAFFWGAAVSAGVAFVVNTLLGMGIYLVTSSDAITELATGSVVAPPVEETLKGLAVLIVFLFFRHEFDSILDGIVYAGITALGFAATENAYYIYNYGYLEGGYEGLFALVFIRVILVGWQHPFYTAFLGIGLAAARLTKSTGLKLIYPILGWAMAVGTHALHNTLAGLLEGLGGLAISTAVDWSGWLFMFGLILWAIWNIQQRVRKYLKEEIELGSMTANQYRTAGNAWAQSMARPVALFNGRYRATNRFYHLAADLAHKKFQQATFGEESGNAQRIRELRQSLAKLSPNALA